MVWTGCKYIIENHKQKEIKWDIYFPSLCRLIPCFSVGNNNAAAEASADSVWGTKYSWCKNNLSKN